MVGQVLWEQESIERRGHDRIQLKPLLDELIHELMSFQVWVQQYNGSLHGRVTTHVSCSLSISPLQGKFLVNISQDVDY